MTDFDQVMSGEKERFIVVEQCRLCSRPKATDELGIVLWGLSILRIEYPGEARFICGDCINKVTEFSNDS